MKKKYHSAMKLLAGALAAVVLVCMVSVSLIRPQEVQAAAADTPTISLSVGSLTLPVGSSFTIQAIVVTPSGESVNTVEWTLGSTNTKLFRNAGTYSGKDTQFTVQATDDASVVTGGAIKQGSLTAKVTTTNNKIATAMCNITVTPKLSGIVTTPGTPSTPTTPTQPTEPTTPTEPTGPDTPTEPTTPTEPPVSPEPDNPSTPGETTAPPENTVITGVIIQNDGTVIKEKVLVMNAIVQDASGTKYITNGTGRKITNQIVTAKDGTMYGTLADGSVPVSETFKLDGKKYLADENGAILVSKFGTTPLGNKVYASEDGSLVQKQLFKVDGKRYYAKRSGCVVRNKWVKVGKKKYYCSANGVITKTKK